MILEVLKTIPTVLVVDDDPNIIAAFRDFLRREGCRMISARGADQAMGKITKGEVDLLISDIRLGYQSGVTLFMQIKSTNPGLPVILITGYPESVTEKDMKVLGADYLFSKPLDIPRIRQAIRACLQLSS